MHVTDLIGKPADLKLLKDGMSPDKGNDSGVVTEDVKINILEGENCQPESNTDSST